MWAGDLRFLGLKLAIFCTVMWAEYGLKISDFGADFVWLKISDFRCLFLGIIKDFICCYFI